ncbi:MAG: hypothetical protein ACRDPO_24265 [Streptosporangiaceae bacterium]
MRKVFKRHGRYHNGKGYPSCDHRRSRARGRKFVYHHHPKAWAGLGFVAGTWLLILGVILCAYGFWWGAALIAVAALELWVAFRLVQSVQA